jgi:hypothetical protein
VGGGDRRGKERVRESITGNGVGVVATVRGVANCLRTRLKLTRKEAPMMGYWFGTHGRDMRRDSCTSAVSTVV